MIPVCYCGNKNYFHGLLMSVLSLAKNSSDSLRIIVLSMDLPEQNDGFLKFTDNQLNILNGALKKYNSESFAEQIDVTDMYGRLFANGKNKNSGYTPYIFLRLLLDIIPDIPDKIIYLDMDTMATGDINILYGVDVSEYEFGAARDYMGKFWINKNYCNSGVLLLNIERIKTTRLFEKCRQTVVNRKMIMPDQSALNRHAQAKLYLPDRFNEQRDRKQDTVIKHFCKGIRYIPFFHIYNIKQWDREKVRKKLKIDWMEEYYEEFDLIAANADLEIKL